MILYPNAYFNNVREITIEFLQKNKINALILDVDNTLIDYDKNFEDGTIQWVERLKNSGIKLYILSNSNKKQKVKKVAEKLRLQYVYFGKKPLKIGFKKVQKRLQEQPENIGVVGDQIFTDILGGNRSKMFTILVEPINEKDIWITMLKRPIENAIKNRYKTKEGEYDKSHTK